MEHFFELPVMHKREELLLQARLVTFGYVYKFHILVDGRELIFEKDDHEEFRVLEQEGNMDKTIDRGLIEDILKVLEKLQS